MCGRATLSSPAEEVARLFDVEPIAIGPARFNIAPTQPILTVRACRGLSEPSGERSNEERDAVDHDRSSGTVVARELAIVRWGLIPWWAKPDEAKKIASKCIQARVETARRSPAFRDAFKRHRCLVVVDGFFEWKTLPDGRSVPHHVRKSRHGPFAIGAVWDSWRPPAPADASPDAPRPARIESCAVLTTRAAGAMKDLHDRMPLVLSRDEWTTWLGGTVEEAARLLEQDQRLLDERARDLVAVPVSTWVNDVRHEDPRCIEPMTGAADEAPQDPQIDFGFARARR